MADNFGLKIGVEGEKEFKKALADINQSFKVLGSEMKLVSSQFDKNDKSVQALSARNNVLNKEIEAQKDKIGTLRQALENAARCGVGLLASAHAGEWADVLRRPILKRLYDGATFERYLLLGRHGRLAAAYDAEGTPLFKEDGTDVEHGGDGHDFAQRDRVCGGGWRDAARSVDSGDAPLYSADERRHSL